MNRIFFFIVAILLISQQSFSQDSWWKQKKFKTESAKQKYLQCKSVFVTIGEGFGSADVYSVSQYFNDEVFLNISSVDKGYYSTEQAKMILENLFSSYPPNSFKWLNSNYSSSYAFASGRYKYSKGGFVNSYSIGVSLKYSSGYWKIDQIILK